MKLSTGFRNSRSLSKAAQFADWLHDKQADQRVVCLVHALAEIDTGIHSPKSRAEIADEYAARNAYRERKVAELEKMIRAGNNVDAAA